MIRLSNGHTFEYMAASGALGYDGRGWPWEQPLRLLDVFDTKLFTAVTKTLTPQRIAGNPYPQSIRLIPNGVVNALGLKNPGFNWWCRHIGKHTKRSRQGVIVSITADDLDPDQLSLMAGKLESFDIVGLELNASCPNTSDGIAGSTAIVAACRAIKERTILPLILKLSVTHQAELIVPNVLGQVEALSVNSVPWAVIHPDRPSPLAKLGGGGVSGGAAQARTWEFARRLKSLSSIPVIGPSIWVFNDLQALRGQGMNALSFGSIWLRYPWRPTLYVRQDRAMIAGQTTARSVAFKKAPQAAPVAV